MPGLKLSLPFASLVELGSDKPFFSEKHYYCFLREDRLTNISNSVK